MRHDPGDVVAGLGLDELTVIDVSLVERESCRV